MIKIFAVLAPVVAASALIGLHAGARPARPAPRPAQSAAPCPRPADPIAIKNVIISEDPIIAGTRVSGTVIATCNVAAVTAQVGTYRIGVPKRSPGIFQTSVDVPHFVWPGRFTLIVTAIRTDGATVRTSMPIELRW